MLSGEPLLVLGASGFLGRVSTARLLRETTCPLLLPVRPHHDPVKVQEAIAAEDHRLTVEDVLARTRVVPLPDHVPDLLDTCREAGVRGILHTAGSVSYHDRTALTAGNEVLTAGALALGRALSVEHFTYVSTAFASGFREGCIRERLHGEPDEDPTDYTASKRACEHLVAASGLPVLILRPSIVVGDSQTGRYSGRPYGIYQLWRGFERLLAHERLGVAHGIASSGRLQIVHQDAVADGLIAALRQFVPGRVLHLVADPAHLPTVRDAWKLWFDHVVQPDTAVFHPRLAAARDHPMSHRQRLYLDFAATNLQIAERTWDFSTQGLGDLGLSPSRADLDSLLRCQHAYIARSPALQAYLTAHAE